MTAMPGHDAGRYTEWLWKGFWWLFVVATLALLAPPIGRLDLGALSSRWLTNVLLLFPMTALVLRSRRAGATPAERWFWGALTASTGILSIALIWSAIAPFFPSSTIVDLANDSAFLAFYFLFALALRSEPAHRQANPLRRGIELAGTVAVMLGLLTYFVLVPGALGVGEYATYLPSLYLFISIDALLVAEAARQWHRNRDNPWRHAYALLTVYISIWLLADVLESLLLAGVIQIPAGSPADIVWNLPAIPLMLLACGRRLGRRRQQPVVTADPRQPATGSLWYQQWVLAFAFFLVGFHFLFYGYGLLDPLAKSPREVVLVATLLVLGTLALLEQARLDRQARRLESEREEALRQSERRSLYLNSLIEHAPLAIVALDPSHRIKVCNPAFEALFGYSRTEVIGRRIDDVITRERARAGAREITQRVEQGRTVRATVTRYRQDGTSVLVDLTGLPMIENGDLVGIFAVYQDVTDRVEALRALRQSEARYRTLVEHAPEAIVIFDMDTGRFVDCNKEAIGLFGLSKVELLRLGPADVSPPRQPNGESSARLARRHLAEVAQGGQRSFEWVHRNSEGAEIHCEIRLTRFPSTERTLVRGSIIDITERLGLQQQLRQAQRMEAIGQLAGGVAHDFNNLLTVIIGYCNLAMMRPDLPDAARDELNEIRKAGDSASALTRQLLAFGRRQFMQPEQVDLNQVVLDMEDMLRRLVGEHIELSSQLDLTLEAAHIDPGQVEQVVANLVVNARDAMPDGGSIVVQTRNHLVEPSDLEPGSEVTPGRFIALEVHDTGVGMDSETLERVFEPFFTTKEVGKGTGLGLSTVYGIVHQCGGHLDVRSRKGRGSSFRVLLPSMSHQTAAPPERRSVEGGSEVVLLVEDEEMVRDLTHSILTDSGYNVLSATTGDEAIELARRERNGIDLLLTDIVLPGLNGREIARRVGSLVDDLKVLFMSGYAADVMTDVDESADRSAFLQKPFTPNRLAAKVREVLDDEPGETRARTGRMS